MPYTEGAHDSPADTKDRLVRVGTKYQTTPPSVADGDNVYLLVDNDGRLLIAGAAAIGSAIDGNPMLLGASDGTNVQELTLRSNTIKHLNVVNRDGNGLQTILVGAADAQTLASFEGGRYHGIPYLRGPDGALDVARAAMDAAPGLGALIVAPIGGDVTLRSSAVAGEAGGTSTAVDNLGWVKGFNCHLDVTAAPSGGSPTLDVYLQTQLASGDWQDIAHFTQATGVTAEIVDWGPSDGNFSGIGAEGAAVTYDRFFAEQDGALGAATIRLMNLGDSMRVKWVFAAGGSTGDFTFAVTTTPHS